MRWQEFSSVVCRVGMNRFSQHRLKKVARRLIGFIAPRVSTFAAGTITRTNPDIAEAIRHKFSE